MTKFSFGKLPHKDLISDAQLSLDEIGLIFNTAAELKRNRELHDSVLRGKKLAMVFEKDSLRTRFTFDVGVTDLGGHAIFMDHRDARIGQRESIRDIAKNLVFEDAEENRGGHGSGHGTRGKPQASPQAAPKSGPRDKPQGGWRP